MRTFGALEKLLDQDLFRALGDPTRDRLLTCLIKCGRECSVSEIAECCVVDYSVVSRHLAVLERAGLVQAHKRGRGVFYQARYERLTGVLRNLAAAIEQWAPRGAKRNQASCCGADCGQ